MTYLAIANMIKALIQITVRLLKYFKIKFKLCFYRCANYCYKKGKSAKRRRSMRRVSSGGPFNVDDVLKEEIELKN